MENEVLKAIRERRSIRRFKADQITDEELKTVLEAGTWAESYGRDRIYRAHASRCSQRSFKTFTTIQYQRQRDRKSVV